MFCAGFNDTVVCLVVVLCMNVKTQFLNVYMFMYVSGLPQANCLQM